ncbi:F-box domain containing protein [Tanacetum coccineum]|uniref:F-box domain containing protein n=1 Tax=Tanacetum coccineum TaxID=301880 RepID=A0ABQ5GYX2_9ASTR
MPMLRLPNILLSVSELSSLTISECELPSSLMVDVLKFKSLKLLSLTRVPIYEGVIEYLTTSCPLLEEIYLKYSYGFTTFCVYRHLSLQKIQILCKSTLERVHTESPNLRYFHLTNKNDKAPSINMASCNKLTTFCYEGAPLKSYTNFLSNFPFMENLSLGLTSPCSHVKLSNHSLRRFELCLNGDMEEIDRRSTRLSIQNSLQRLRCPRCSKLVGRPMDAASSSNLAECVNGVLREIYVNVEDSVTRLILRSFTLTRTRLLNYLNN